MRLLISLSLFTLLAGLGLGCERKNTTNNDQKGNDPPITTTAASSPTSEEELKGFAGDWEVVSIEDPPPFHNAEYLKDLTAKIEGNKIKLSEGIGYCQQGEIRLDPTKSPKQFDLISLDEAGKPKTIKFFVTGGPKQGPQERQVDPLLGIYSIAGDQLTIAISDRESYRPTEFKPSVMENTGGFVTVNRRAATHVVIVVLKRSTATPADRAQKAAEKNALANLQLLGIGYQNYLIMYSRPPRTIDEVKTEAHSNKPADFSHYHIIWGVDLTSIAQPRSVLAYEVDTPKKGGFVLLVDGKVERVSADEFQKLPQAAPLKPTLERTSDVKLTPSDYYAEFKKLGEFGIREKYDGKVIELKGIVKGLHFTGSKPELLVTGPGNGEESVRCIMYDGGEFWAKVSKGQEVTVKGLFRKPIGPPQDNPMLIECVIAGTGPSMAVTIAAEDLAKEVVADDEKAKAKYKGKSFILTGEVVSVEDAGSTTWVKLKGAKDQPLACSFHSGSSIKEQVKKLVPGTKIKLYAEYEAGTRLMNCELISK